jgi:hypothetical protein
VALLFVLFNFLLTTTSLSITHELRRPADQVSREARGDTSRPPDPARHTGGPHPLPRMGARHFRGNSWPLDISGLTAVHCSVVTLQVLIMFSTLVAAFTVLLHKHRSPSPSHPLTLSPSHPLTLTLTQIHPSPACVPDSWDPLRLPGRHHDR